MSRIHMQLANGFTSPGYVGRFTRQLRTLVDGFGSPDEVALGILIGSLLGFGFRHLMKFCERKNLIDRHSYVAQVGRSS